MIDYDSYLEQLALADRKLSTRYQAEVEGLLNQLEAHEVLEREFLDDYRRAAETSEDRGVRFLMGLITQDEERHHRLVAAMAEDVRRSLNWSEGEQPLPRVEASPASAPELLSQTERFLKIERDNLDDLKDLKHIVRDLNSGLLELIVEGMEDDTRKHVEILKYIRKRLSGRGS